MEDRKQGFTGPEWLILLGGCGFVVVLAVSAYWEADIRWLHFFQAWMYIAAMILSLRHNRWGYFIGASIGGLWDYMNLFVTSFFRSGMTHLSRWIHTGHLARPDQAIAVPGWISNLLLVIGCVWAYRRLRRKTTMDVLKLFLAFALSTGFFWLDISLCQPRYRALFPRLLHPHAP